MRRFVKPLLCLKIFSFPNPGQAQHTARLTTDLTSIHTDLGVSQTVLFTFKENGVFYVHANKAKSVVHPREAPHVATFIQNLLF